MRDIFYLAWRYLAHHRFKTVVLVAAVATVISLPLGLNILVSRSSEHLTARASATPLLVGAKGSPLELVLSSLYFESEPPPEMPLSQARRIDDSELAQAIPIYARFHAQGYPIVGTTLDYFSLRGLRITQGRSLAVLGECVVGARAAEAVGVTPGGSLVSSPETVFDLAGSYPLKMAVVGVLEPTGGPDDRTVFVDLKTAWVMAGLAHGHQDLARPEAAQGVLRRDGDTIVANASVREYTEITPDNIDSFHFHGDPAAFPITAAIAVPRDEKSGTLLQGRYLGDDEEFQIVRPETVMNELLETILTVRRYVTAAVAGVGFATLATMALVFSLSLQIRRREMETMKKIGASPGRTAAVVAVEILGVLVAGAIIAGVVSAVLWRIGDAAVRMVVLWA